MTDPALLQGLAVSAYGNSFLAAPEGWSYLNLLADRHSWRVDNGALGGTRALDAAATAIASGSPHQWQPWKRQVAVIDASTNDMYSSGMAGLPGYINAMRALLAFLSLEGPIDSEQAVYSSGWTKGSGREWYGGSTRSGGPTATLATFSRAGRWAVGYYGLAAGTGAGGVFDLYANGGKVGSLACNSACLGPNPTSPTTYDGGPRNWTACAGIVNLSQPAAGIEVRRTDQAGGPWLDWWGKVNEDWSTVPLIVCTAPLYSPAAGYALGAATDAVVDAYATALRQVAAEVGPHVRVVDARPGWDPDRMVRRDHMHPNQLGNVHIADAIDAELAAIDWIPYTDS